MRYFDLFWQLTVKEIKARYKQSFLGFAWAGLVPLLNLLVLSLVFSNLFRIPTNNVPYPIYLFVALVPWIFTSNSIAAATGSVLSHAALVTKVMLPREIIPISAISAKLIDLFFSSLILVIFLIIYKIEFHHTIFFLPVIFITHLLLITGVSLFLSATNVFFRDIENILGVFLTLWMYLTPIVYSKDLIPGNLIFWFQLNPMTEIINSYRDVVLFGRMPNEWFFYYCLPLSLVVCLLGLAYFRKRAKYFADVI